MLKATSKDCHVMQKDFVRQDIFAKTTSVFSPTPNKKMKLATQMMNVLKIFFVSICMRAAL